MSALGDAVREARVARRWSQAALAAEAGLNERTVARLEAGHRVSAGSVDAVLGVLGIDMPREDEKAPESVGKAADAPHTGIGNLDWTVGLPPAVDADHQRKRGMLLRTALAHQPGAVPIVTDVLAFDAASQARVPTPYVGLPSAERVRRAVRDRNFADRVVSCVAFVVTMPVLCLVGSWGFSPAAPSWVAPLVGVFNLLAVLALMMLGMSSIGDMPIHIVWPFLARIHGVVDWTRRSARLREVAWVVRGPVLTECVVTGGRVAMYEYRLDIWSAEVKREGPKHVTVTLRADGRFNEVLEFVPVGPGLDALLAGAGAGRMPLAA